MHRSLEKILEKRGIKDVSELDPTEQETFDKWNKSLSDGVITVDKIEDFCRQQLDIIDLKFKDMDNSAEKNQRLIILHNVYKSMLGAISKPKQEREQLEKFLLSLTE